MIHFLLLLLLSKVTFSSPLKEWTYLFYVAGDEEEIDPFSRVPIKKLEQVGSDQNSWIIAHVDLYFDENGKDVVEEKAKRYQIEKFNEPFDPYDFKTLKIRSPIVWESEDETNSASADSLEDFIVWAKNKYPAKHYAVFLLGHSWGWRGVMQDYRPGVQLPPIPGGPEVTYFMGSIKEWGHVFSRQFANQKLDLLVLDTCHGGVLELAYEIRDSVKVMVASPTEMPFMSFDYVRTFKRQLNSQTQFARYLVSDALETYSRDTGTQVKFEREHPAVSMFALDIEKFKPFWSMWNDLLKNIPLKSFQEQFLYDNYHQDLSSNVDLIELLTVITQNRSFESIHPLAFRLLHFLDDGIPDFISAFWNIPTEDADSIKLVLQGDELLPSEKSLENAKLVFDYLNPHLRNIKMEWNVRDSSKSRRDLTALMNNPFPLLRIRPFIAGASWVTIELKKSGKLVSTIKLKEPKTFHYKYPISTPYIITGQTFGAIRNRGLSVFLNSTVDKDGLESFHFDGKEWLGGESYYRELSISKSFPWANLLFNNFFKNPN